MPSNPEQIHYALRELGRGIESQSQALKNAQEESLRLLHTCARDHNRLRGLVESVVQSFDQNLRCAVPDRDLIDSAFSCAATPEPRTLLAVDGSQSTPNRHEEVLFGLINIGAVTMKTHSGETPRVEVDTRLLFGKDLFSEYGGVLSDGDIALQRDAAERASLLKHAHPSSISSIAFTDGPLELWGAKDVTDPQAYHRALSEYLQILRELQHREWSVAGYVDKPGAELVIRLLELSQAQPGDLRNLRHYHPFRGVSDRWLFGQILPSKHRSAIFALQSSSKARYPDGLSLRFFYLNVGDGTHPVIVRIEIPQWVAESETRVNDLQNSLIEQCDILGARPYPYILHRAHETARISLDEVQQIKLRILLELRHHAVEPDGLSAKSSAKHVSGIKGTF